MKRRAPAPLAGAVEALTAVLAPATPLARVQGIWSDAVGATVAREAQPVAERGGLLTLACRSAVWAQELDLMALDVCRRVNEALGDDVVHDLRCLARPARITP